MAQITEFVHPPKILLGAGAFSRLGDIASAMGRRVFVVHNGIDHSPQTTLHQLKELFDKHQIESELFRQRGEPVVDAVNHATDAARRHKADFIIGIGGGSAIDAAKAVAALLANGGSALDYMEVIGLGQKITRPAMPWIAIPTTAGTGAEATRNAVVGCPEKRFKASIRSELMLPRLALIDPELQVHVSPAVTAASGMDALCQLIESYTSINASLLTDAMALAGIPLAGKALRRAYLDGSNVAARQDMATAALWSGIALTNAGLGAVHGFAAPMGANFPIPHGVVCAALLPSTLKANIAALLKQSAHHPLLARYATIGKRLSEQPHLSDAAALEACQDFVLQLVIDLHIPRLAEFGMKPADIPPMVALAKKASSMRYNPVVLNEDELSGILAQAL